MHRDPFALADGNFGPGDPAPAAKSEADRKSSNRPLIGHSVAGL